MSFTDIFGDKPEHHHLALSVSDLDKAKAWYEEMLGFKVDRELKRDHLRAAVVTNQGFEIELIELYKSAPSPVAFQKPDDQMVIRGMTHYAFKVPNLDKTMTALMSKGANIAVYPTAIEELKARFLHIYDLDGNLLEFVEPFPAISTPAKNKKGLTGTNFDRVAGEPAKESGQVAAKVS